MINKGNATAKDVIQLMENVREKVKEEFKDEIETGVKIVGEEF